MDRFTNKNQTNDGGMCCSPEAHDLEAPHLELAKPMENPQEVTPKIPKASEYVSHIDVFHTYVETTKD